MYFIARLSCIYIDSDVTLLTSESIGIAITSIIERTLWK